ncbi:MAG: response regulator transcription factor [Eubacterium sp.]|nr:response regulator transcription factor [Eubacterium sp.]
MRICIVDDDTLMCQELENRIVKKLGKQFCEIVSFNGERPFLRFAENNSIDVMFIDVKLKEDNGIETAKKVRTLYPQVITVFISAYPQYVFNSFETEPLNYLLKPIDGGELNTTLDRIIKKYHSYHHTIAVKNRYDTVNIELIDICYIEGYNRKITYHLISGEKVTVRGNLTKALSQVETYDFVRCHQGFIVNMKYIKAFDEDEIILRNGGRIPVSVRKKLDTKQAYFTYANRG